MKPSHEALRARFRTLQLEIEQVRAQAAPYRTAYDNKRNELANREREELGPLKSSMKEVEAPLYNLEQELASISRQLRGKTGDTNG